MEKLCQIPSEPQKIINVLSPYFLRKFLPKVLNTFLLPNQKFKGEAFFDESTVFIILIFEINFQFAWEAL